jgi:dTDP-4-dehydrorhamnose reductase
MENFSSQAPFALPPVELWGSLECTRNRVGDEYFDQLDRSGHAHRDADLDAFAALGLRTLRYPMPWERIAPEGPRWADWSWPNARLGRLQAIGIRPVVGFLHGGSGPPDLSPLDSTFPTRLAGYARAFAERYPWVESYAPIDAPMRTALRCGLEGRWYPHRRDERSFARAMMVQCRAIALTMRAVREVTPHARLVQTEWVGHTRSTPALAPRAEFENERRWLTFDLLAGRLKPGHPLYGYLVRAKVNPAELARFAEKPCPPDLFGLNYEVTGERFLDERGSLYPTELRADVEGLAHADVGAVHACAEGLRGPARLLGEAHRRYGAPVAITDTRLASTPDERMRWLVHVWREARFARLRGVDVRAVTAGALLGVHGRAPLFADDAHYEPGAFMLSKGEPRPTIVTEAVQALAAGYEPEHRVLGRPGWWQRPARLRYAPFEPTSLGQAHADVAAE